jgi:hypothetical protein
LATTGSISANSRESLTKASAGYASLKRGKKAPAPEASSES